MILVQQPIWLKASNKLSVGHRAGGNHGSVFFCPERRSSEILDVFFCLETNFSFQHGNTHTNTDGHRGCFSIISGEQAPKRLQEVSVFGPFDMFLAERTL